jgi:hypothetical protein
MQQTLETGPWSEKSKGLKQPRGPAAMQLHERKRTRAKEGGEGGDGTAQKKSSVVRKGASHPLCLCCVLQRQLLLKIFSTLHARTNTTKSLTPTWASQRWQVQLR